jgi:tetratricopeptide (TPR) repeat protein
MFKKSGSKRLYWIAIVSLRGGVINLGFAGYTFFCNSVALTLPVDTQACGEFLINDPRVDILKKTIPSEKGKEYLQQKNLSDRAQIQKNKEDGAADSNLGEALRHLGDLESAGKSYQKALNLNPNLQEAKMVKGLIKQDLGNVAATDKAIQDALAQNESAIDYFNQGLALFKQKDFKGAEAAFRKAIELDSKSVLAHTNLGVVLERQGKLEEAITEYRQAIRVDPNYAFAHTSLGYALEKQGKLEEAIAEYRQGIRLDPKDAYAHTSLGYALEKQGKLVKAIAEYRQAIRLDPNYAYARTKLGLALEKQGKLEEAITEYRQAIRVDPNYAYAYNSLGLALEKQGKLEEAVTEYRQAIRVEPDYAYAYSNLGSALNKQGKVDEAITSYKKARDFYRAQGYTSLADGVDQTLRQMGVQ